MFLMDAKKVEYTNEKQTQKILENMKIFNNNNGYDYIIIDVFHDIALLEKIGGGYQPFIVALGINENTKDWKQGRYFENSYNAKNHFNDWIKTKKEVFWEIY